MGSGARMNWKALSDIKDEEMGHGEKVQAQRIQRLGVTLTFLYSELMACEWSTFTIHWKDYHCLFRWWRGKYTSLILYQNLTNG